MNRHPWTLRSLSRQSAVAVLAAVTLLLGLSMPPAPAIAAAGDSTVYWGAKAGPIDIPAKWGTVAALPLPKGRFLVTATAVLVGAGGSYGKYLGVECRLVLGSQVDRIRAAPTWKGKSGSRVPILLNVGGRLKSPASARLRCDGKTKKGDVRIRDIRITAVSAGRLTLQKRLDLSAKRATYGSGKPRIISARAPIGAWVQGDRAMHDVGTLDLGPGRWWLIARVVAKSATLTSADYRCSLRAGADWDVQGFGLAEPVQAGDHVPLVLQVVHQFDTTETVRLRCAGPAGYHASDLSLIAIKVGKLSNRWLDGVGEWNHGSGSPRVISGFADLATPVPVSPTYVTLKKLDLPRGHWVVLAKLHFAADSVPADSIRRRALCRLRFGNDVTPSQVQYAANISATAPLVMSVNHRAKAPQLLKLQCRRTASGGTGYVLFVKITAMKAGSLVRRHL